MLGQRKLTTSKSCEIFTPSQMYEIVKNRTKVGIAGYECPKNHFDYRGCLWIKKRAEILARRRNPWPPESWKSDKETGKKIPPKRRDFIDDQIKWANSFNDPKKSEEVKNELESKGKKIGEIRWKSDFDKKINSKNLLELFRNREEELKKIREQKNSIPDSKQDAINQVIEKMKNNEYKPRVGKSNWSRDARIMYSADNEYLAEQYPFWNPNTKETDKEKAEFRPNKLKLLRKSPSYSFGPKNRDAKSSKESAAEYIKARDEKLEEKANSVLQKIGVERNKYFINPIQSYDKVNSHGRLPHIFRKKFDFASTEQYKIAHEKKNYETPAPNMYWDDGKSRVKLRPNIEEAQEQKYIMSPEKTFKRVYLAGRKKSVF